MVGLSLGQVERRSFDGKGGVVGKSSLGGKKQEDYVTHTTVASASKEEAEIWSASYFLRGCSTVGRALSKCGFKALNAENQLPAET